MVKEMLDLVGLAQSHLNRYPHALAARAKTAYWRALVTSPRLIICDEPVCIGCFGTGTNLEFVNRL